MVYNLHEKGHPRFDGLLIGKLELSGVPSRQNQLSPPSALRVMLVKRAMQTDEQQSELTGITEPSVCVMSRMITNRLSVMPLVSS